MTVLGLASSIAAFVKVRLLGDKEIIDTFDFRLHYRFTTAALFLACVLCSATSLLGDPISCIVEDDKKKKAITTFCWITSTFTVPKLKGGIPGVDVAAHNVGPDAGYENSIVHHNYYQWVPFVLFFQGVLFYIPHWFWKKWEGGLIRTVSTELRGPQTDDGEVTKKKTDRVCNYIITSWKMHNMYAVCYAFCVALNFINTIGNIFLIDRFLGGTFMKYGIKVLQLSEQEFRSDPMADVFPKITKCTFHYYGHTGSINKIDAMCVLALNVLNEKIFIFLWLWLVILAIISGLGLLYTLAVLLFPYAREFSFQRGFKIASSSTRSVVARKLSAGDYLILHFLGQNIRSAAFQELMKGMCDNLSNKYPDRNPNPPFSHEKPNRLYPEMVPLYTNPSNPKVAA